MEGALCGRRARSISKLVHATAGPTTEGWRYRFATPRANAIFPRDTASRALQELVDLGFTEETRHGGFSRKTRVASEWRLTAFRCDLTGAPKTCAFMQRGVPARESRLVRARPQTGRLSQTTAHACPKRRP